MPHQKFYPTPNTYNINTNRNVEEQIFQELISIRYKNRCKGVRCNKSISPWIDQAKIYYEDAMSDNWRSAGLLYYYSFLNLAKALLVCKGRYSLSFLKSTSIYHGLGSEPQNVNKLSNFELSIHPTTNNGRQNIFSNLYEILTKQNWPFSNVINVPLGIFMPYMAEISVELWNIFKINRAIFPVKSLRRIEKVNNKNYLFFEAASYFPDELLVDRRLVKEIPSKISAKCFEDWNDEYPNIINMTHFVFLKRRIKARNRQELSARTKRFINDVKKIFLGYAYPSKVYISEEDNWLFLKKITINGKKLYWHPILSDYLFSFAISTILRYQPHILEKDNGINGFIAEAWCTQSTVTALRYFLMSFEQPSIRIIKY